MTVYEYIKSLGVTEMASLFAELTTQMVEKTIRVIGINFKYSPKDLADIESELRKNLEKDLEVKT